MPVDRVPKVLCVARAVARYELSQDALSKTAAKVAQRRPPGPKAFIKHD
jgi:hypothetical protein